MQAKPPTGGLQSYRLITSNPFGMTEILPSAASASTAAATFSGAAANCPAKSFGLIPPAGILFRISPAIPSPTVPRFLCARQMSHTPQGRASFCPKYSCKTTLLHRSVSAA